MTPVELGRLEGAPQTTILVASQVGRCLEITTTTAGLHIGLIQNRVVGMGKLEEVLPPSPPHPALLGGVRTPVEKLAGHVGATGDLASTFDAVIRLCSVTTAFRAHGLRCQRCKINETKQKAPGRLRQPNF